MIIMTDGREMGEERVKEEKQKEKNNKRKKSSK